MKSFLILFLTGYSLVGCQSDETLNRDEVRTHAIRQEYSVEYSIPQKRLKSFAYFKTSASGDYIKLSSADEINFNSTGTNDYNFTKMTRTRAQIYPGSRNVPAYRHSQDYDLRAGEVVAWEWYDHESDETYTTEKQIIYPALHMEFENRTIDTTRGEDLVVNLSIPLEKKQTLCLSFKGTGSRSANFCFYGEAVRDRKITITAQQLAERLQPRPEDTNDSNNTGETQERLEGRHALEVSTSLRSENKVYSGNGKNSVVRVRISYPDTGFEVIL